MIAPYWNKRNGKHKQRRHPEHELQKRVIQFLRLALPAEALSFSVDHAGGGRLQAAMKQGRGVIAGLPDVWIIWQGQTYTIELKSDTGQLSDAQRQTMLLIMKAGGKVGMARSLDDVQETLAGWSIPLRARLPGRQPPAVAAARAGGA